MHLFIERNNEHLFSLLNKNPRTDEGLYAFEIGDGVVVGSCIENGYLVDWFTEGNYYAIDKTNRIDLGILHRPKIAIHIIDKMFGDILKDGWENKTMSWLDKTNGELDTKPVSADINGILIKSNWVKNEKFILSKYFHQISADRIEGDLYNIHFTNCKNLRECLSLMVITAMLTEITNDYEGDKIEEAFVNKYLNILTRLDNVPYFIFYLFCSRVVKNENMYRNLLNTATQYLTNNGYNVNLNLRNTHQNRVNVITEYLGVDKPILDYGCGEFIYLKRFLKNGFKGRYYAYDLNKDLYKIGLAIRNRSEFENLKLLNDDELPTEQVNVVVTEVIEHLEYDKSVDMIQSLIDNIDFDKFVFTTPNKSFNKHYFIPDDEFRHPDHKFELDRYGLVNYLSKLRDVTYEIEGVGDTIDGESTTWLVKLKRNGK